MIPALYEIIYDDREVLNAVPSWQASRSECFVLSNAVSSLPLSRPAVFIFGSNKKVRENENCE